MRVLSLFNGCGGAQMAFTKLGITPEVVYSSEVDKYAIKVNMRNYPDTIQVGDVRDLKAEDFKDIDLICGGSPCQSFSFAGKRKGMSTKDEIEILSLKQYLELKSEGFEFEGQSYLFWEFVRLVQEVKPMYFFLENVVMTSNWETVISDALGVKPMKINSALVSAQNRVRLYWFNFGARSLDLFGNDNGSLIPQPKDTKIYLKNVLESGCVDRDKSLCILSRYDGTTLRTYEEKSRGQIVYKGGAIRGRRLDESCNRKDNTDNPIQQQIEIRNDGKTNCITTVQKDNIVVYDKPKVIGDAGISNFESNNRVYSPNGKSPTVKTCQGGGTEPKVSQDSGVTWRKLTPIECERLQGMPDNYTDCVSNSQRYKMIGNGWNIETIAYIFSKLN